jgi:hypothetical protein
MRAHTILALALVLAAHAASGCGAKDALAPASDAGAFDGTADAGGADAAADALPPPETSIMAATSSDGLTWTRLPQPVAQRGGSPGAMFDGQKIRLYFMGPSQPPASGLFVAMSANGGPWEQSPVMLTGLPAGHSPQDPEVVRTGDGKFRMYYYEYPDGSGEPLWLPGLFTIALAVSDDGISFQRTGAALQKEKTMDPSVIRIGSVLRMFTSYSQDPDWKTSVSVSTDDGLTFTFEKYLDLDCWVNSVLAVPGGYRMYCNDGTWFKTPGGRPDIRSAFSSDGTTWVQDPGIRLAGAGSMAAAKAGDVYWLFYTIVASGADAGTGGCAPPCQQGQVCCGAGPCAGTCVPDCRLGTTQCPAQAPKCDNATGLCTL